jgi:hypothetical protein
MSTFLIVWLFLAVTLSCVSVSLSVALLKRTRLSSPGNSRLAVAAVAASTLPIILNIVMVIVTATVLSSGSAPSVSSY